jgi:ectoine hydroxylase-related dioxygenase (phytanoyl-CoA dioxygenase family)
MPVIDPVRRHVLGAADLADLQARTRAIEAWPVGSHVWGHYAEETPSGPAICRTENVSACEPGIAALVDGELAALAAAVLGAPVVAFKDKLNYKQPGGAGFSPHQDRLAYPGVDRVMSILLAIDDCSRAAGCLWLATDVDEVLPVDDRGVVRADVGATLEWTPAELAPGDAVCIDGLAPHYSEANTSDAARRVFVASYAPVSEGYSRDTYYGARRDRMKDAIARDGRFRISTLADFDGVEVAAAGIATDRCTHP